MIQFILIQEYYELQMEEEVRGAWGEQYLGEKDVGIVEEGLVNMLRDRVLISFVYIQRQSFFKKRRIVFFKLRKEKRIVSVCNVM